MERKSWRRLCTAGCAGLVLLGGVVSAQESGTTAATPQAAGSTPDASAQVPADVSKKLTEQGEQLDAMRSQINAYTAQLDAMKRALVAQEENYHALRHAVGMDVLDAQRGGNINAAGTGATALPMPADQQGDQQAAVKPVGQAPAPPQDDKPPAVAPISDQPGVLTPRGALVVEPSYQYSYSSVERVDLIGYTIIPAILIGLIDAREVHHTDCHLGAALWRDESAGIRSPGSLCRCQQLYDQSRNTDR